MMDVSCAPIQNGVAEFLIFGAQDGEQCIEAQYENEPVLSVGIRRV